MEATNFDNWTDEYLSESQAKATEFIPMSDQDKNYLENSLVEYTFNDSDQVKRICGIFVNFDNMSEE